MVAGASGIMTTGNTVAAEITTVVEENEAETADIKAADIKMADMEIAGKRICVFGDSYVRNHSRPVEESWHFKAAKALGIEYVNYGINGSSVMYDRTDRGFGVAMTERYKTLPDSLDCLLIIAGHNDAVMIPDENGLKEFRNALESLFTNLQARYPKAKIGYVLPWMVEESYFKEVREIIKDVCNTYAIPVFDAGDAGQIRVNDDGFRSQYFQNGGINDKAHLNAAGHDLIVAKGEEFIKSLMTGR